MNRKIILMFSAIVAALLGFGAFSFPEKSNNSFDTDNEKSVLQVLELLGEKDIHKINFSKGVSVEKGKELVHKGYFTDSLGKRSTKLSKFYVCTTCHNIQKEFADLSFSGPEARLDYAIEKGIPFLQASSFYGILNRNSFFNGDYQEIYKNLPGAREANADLRTAIDFCAQNNALSRKLDPLEIESILAYFSTLQLKMSDLLLNDNDKNLVFNALSSGVNKAAAVEMIKSKFVSYMPATILKIPKFKRPDDALYLDTKRLKKGKAIYELACLHCHLNKKYSFFGLDNNLLTFKAMEKATRTENYIFSMYFLVREGLAPRKGHRSHMPLFTAEKMSPEQLESLYLYVSARAKKMKID